MLEEYYGIYLLSDKQRKLNFHSDYEFRIIPHTKYFGNKLPHDVLCSVIVANQIPLYDSKR
jgi:hypothetical protein